MTGASGIRVIVISPYRTFVAQLIGQATLQAQADSTSLFTITSTTPPGTPPYPVQLGGTDCDNLTTKIDFNFAWIQNATFEQGAYTDGSLGVGAYNNNTQFKGNVVVRAIAGLTTNGAEWNISSNTYTAIQSISGKTYSSDPFYKSGSPSWIGGSTYVGPTADYLTNPTGVSAALGMSSWAYIWVDRTSGKIVPYNTPGSDKTLITAESFRPTTGPFYKTFHNFMNFTTTTPALADAKVSDGTTTGVVFVDGDLTGTNKISSSFNAGVTLVATGYVTIDGNNNDYGTAGILAKNISVLAGKNPGDGNDASGNKLRCATDGANAILTMVGNHTSYTGVLYVPYGQARFTGNFDNCPSCKNGPIIAYSLNLGSAGSGGDNDQNQDFNLSTNELGYPTVTSQHRK